MSEYFCGRIVSGTMDADEQQRKIYHAMTNRYRVRLAVLGMLSDRGYDVSNLRMPLDEYVATFEERTQQEDRGFVVQPAAVPSRYNKTQTEPFLVYISSDPKKLGVGPIVKMVKNTRDSGHAQSVLVCAQYPTPKAIEHIEKQRPAFWIDVFTYAAVMNNPLENTELPRQFRVVTSVAEQEALVEAFGTLTSFPSILRPDPVARYLGLRLGDLLEATYVSNTTAKYREVRVCRLKPSADKVFEFKRRK